MRFAAAARLSHRTAEPAVTPNRQTPPPFKLLVAVGGGNEQTDRQTATDRTRAKQFQTFRRDSDDDYCRSGASSRNDN
jgi:hypothetical protein